MDADLEREDRVMGLRKTRTGWTDDERAHGPATPATISRSSATRGRNVLRPVLVIALVIGALAVIGQSPEKPYSAPNTYVAPPAADNSWVPSGLSVSSDDPTVAWRWMTASEVDCTYSDGSCWGIFAVPHNGCPSSLYIELSVLDAAGNAIGLTNDVAGAVQPMQQAKLVFDTFEKGADKARIAKVSCY
jgi:hypothetical protein